MMNKTLFSLTLLLVAALHTTLVQAEDLIIPLYVNPETDEAGNCSSEEYVKVATSAEASRTLAIVNPNNGPDYGSEFATKLAFDECIAYLQDHGVVVLGYVQIKSGNPNVPGHRDFDEITTDIDQWSSEYMVDGIFVDELLNRRLGDGWDSMVFTSFKQEVVNYILDGVFTRAILNPGSIYFEKGTIER